MISFPNHYLSIPPEIVRKIETLPWDSNIILEPYFFSMLMKMAQQNLNGQNVCLLQPEVIHMHVHSELLRHQNGHPKISDFVQLWKIHHKYFEKLFKNGQKSLTTSQKILENTAYAFGSVLYFIPIFLSILNTLGMFLKCGVFEERTTHALLCILNFQLSSSSSRNFVMNFPGAYSISVNYILSWSSWVVIVYQHNIPVFNKGLIWSHKSIYKMNTIKKKCESCGKSFSLAGDLKRHIQTVHKGCLVTFT